MVVISVDLVLSIDAINVRTKIN